MGAVILMTLPESEKVEVAVLKEAKEGSISCTVARKLAADLQVSPGVIGEACNRLKIKIFACELGCFR